MCHYLYPLSLDLPFINLGAATPDGEPSADGTVNGEVDATAEQLEKQTLQDESRQQGRTLYQRFSVVES